MQIVVMGLMAACVGHVIGRAFEGLGPIVGVVLAGAAGLSAGLIATVRPEGPPGVTWRRLEILIYPIVAVAVVGISTGSTRLGPTAVAVGIVLIVRSLIEATVADLMMMERILDDRPTGAPPDRIRLRVLGVGLGLASVAGYTLGVNAGFSDLSRPAVGGQLVAVVVWFALGIVGTGVVSRRFRARAWKVNEVDVHDGLSERWAAGVAGVAVLVVVVALGVPYVTGQVSAAPARVVSQTDGLEGFVTRALDFLSRDAGGGGSDRSAGDDDAQGSIVDVLEQQAGDRPSWIGDVVLTAIIATVFLLAIRAGRNARFRQGGRPVGSGGWSRFRELLAIVVSEIRALVTGVLTWFRRIRRRRRTSPPQSGERETTAGPKRKLRWAPQDRPERRIARAFVEIVDHEPPLPGETPAEVTRRIGARTDESGARLVLGGYLRARYSPHPVDEQVAADVEGAARRVTGALRDPDETVEQSDPGSEPGHR